MSDEMKDTGVLTKDELLAIDDIHMEEVTFPDGIPGWTGKKALLRVIPGRERDQFENWCVQRKNGKKFDSRGVKTRLVARALVNPDGTQMFKDSELEALNAKSGAAISFLFQEAQKINGMDTKGEEDLTGE